MHKSKMADLIEAIVTEVSEKTGGDLDASGARALVGFAIKKLRGQIVALSSPEPSGNPQDLLRVGPAGVVGVGTRN
jgi:hypothetical protein